MIEEITASIRIEPGVFAIYHRATPHFQKYVTTTQSAITARRLIQATPIVK